MLKVWVTCQTTAAGATRRWVVHQWVMQEEETHHPHQTHQTLMALWQPAALRGRGLLAHEEGDAPHDAPRRVLAPVRLV